jgi:amino acid adenylation domain-containing protein
VVSKSASETYSRPITPLEWWKCATLRGLVEEVQICVEGDGAIDPAALGRAVAEASEACPGARVVRRGQRWVDSGRAPEVRIAEAADFDRTRLSSPWLRTPLTGRKFSCEVIWAPGDPATVVFRAHPGVMDGQGVLWWQRQVFGALRGEAAEGTTSRLTSGEVRAEIAAGLGTDPPPLAPAPPGPEWRSVLGTLPSGPRRSRWRRRTIDGIHPSVVAKIARLVTAYGDGERDGLVEIPVDLRQFLPGLRTTAAVTGAISLLVRESDDWSDVDASLLTALRERRFLAHQDDPTTLAMPLAFMREMCRWGDNTARQNHDHIRANKLATHMTGVSHLGPVDLADFSADGFEATSCYALGTVVYVPEFDIVESRGRTEITVAWRDGPGVAERMEALLDWIEEDLSPRSNRLWDGNRTDRPAPPDTLTSLFAEQVARTPGAVAVIGPDGDLSYAQLRDHAAAVTAALQARGTGRGDMIGLVAGRTPAAIAAIWGILAAGAAYLPIDPGYPGPRMTQLLTDARASACLLESPAAHQDALPPGCQPIALDTLPSAAPGPWPPPGTGPADHDVACVIYTSGSTGTPKGVEIEHRALVNYARWATREARLDATTRMPLIASLAFDMAGCAIYLPLLNGGAVLPVPEVNAATLRHVIEDRGATAMAITPSHLDLINQSGIRHPAMRVIMTAGELLRRSTALRAREIFGPACAILCQWGPTETTIVNTSHTFDPDTDTDAGVPFGRPMDNNTVYLLDARGRHVPPGEPGEACVGGIQLARGYLGRPDLTRARFTRLADGTRVYRTGDIARLLPTGELAFIARTDDQVKIAGHRIEPAEIAQALEEHPGVRQAAVIPRTRPGRHDKELCAYITGDTGASPADLKEFLAARLPSYMIPAAIIAVPEIPRTPNGKTDTRQLPDPFSGAPSTDTPAPHRDHITSTVAGIWARTLQVDPHLIYDQTDFREIGGTSMLMLTMIDEVSRTVAGDAHAEFMAELDQLIREPTLGRLSDVARQTRINHLARQQANVR